MVKRFWSLVLIGVLLIMVVPAHTGVATTVSDGRPDTSGPIIHVNPRQSSVGQVVNLHVTPASFRGEEFAWTASGGRLLQNGTRKITWTASAPGSYLISVYISNGTRAWEVSTTVEVRASTKKGDDPSDSDGDGLLDATERDLKTDPDNPDTDSDGITDGLEVAFGTDPRKADTDHDGLTDAFEQNAFSKELLNPLSRDSDGDHDSDDREDPDADGLANAREQVLGTNPFSADTDGDDIQDGLESEQHGTNPLEADTDGDGLDDGSEVRFGTNPLVPDTDGDGVLDGGETFSQSLTSDDLGVSVVFSAAGNAQRQHISGRQH